MSFICSCNNLQDLQCQKFRWMIANYMKVLLMKNVLTSFDSDAENVLTKFLDIHNGYSN